MKYIYIILFPLTLIIPTIVLYLVNRSYRKEIIAKCSNIYGLELDTARIQFEILKKTYKFKDYPIIEKTIKDMVYLSKNCYIDLEKIKIKRYKIFDLHPIYESLRLMDEIDACNNKEIVELLNRVLKINKKIGKVRFPYFVKINRFLFNLQMMLIAIVVIIFKKYKDITRKDVVQAEKNSDFKDGIMTSGLTYQ